MSRALAIAVAVLWALAAAAAGAPFWGAREARPFDAPIGALKHGEFTWAPELAPAGPILVLLSLDEQRTYVYRTGLPGVAPLRAPAVGVRAAAPRGGAPCRSC